MSSPDAVLAAPASAVGAATFCEAFLRSAARHAEKVAVRTPGDEVSLTWAQAAATVRRLTAGMAARGVRRGDTVGMVLLNRPEFHLLDWAALHAGATPFSVYVTSPPEQVEHVLANAAPSLLITERAFLDNLLAARERAGSTAEVVVIDGAEGHLSLEDLAEAGEPGFDFDASWGAVQPDDVAVIIYTSGTTGPSKGVQLTHRSLLTAWRLVSDAVPGIRRTGSLVTYLPHAHLADRIVCHYTATVSGSSLTCVGDPRQVLDALPDARPTLFMAVPRLWEKLKDGLDATLAGLEDEAARAAAAHGLELGIALARGERLEPGRRGAYDAIDRQLFAPLRARLGLDRAETLVSGAAPIAADVLEFFAALGLPIVEAYGMSESSAVSSITRPGELRFGTVGRPLDGLELRLADDGEILVRGEVVMVGYRNDPAQTAEAIDADGWLHTGDVGAFDDDGNLRIIDRKKELIINAAGKNMSPANIENAIKSGSPLIAQVVALGDRRPYNTALIVLDPDACEAYARREGLADGGPEALSQDPMVLEIVAAAVEEGNARLSRIEQVKRFTVLPDSWLPGSDVLTPTLKLRRKPIAERYAEAIDGLYTRD
jgi:long-chain acyl-CoA synthetase